SWGVFLAGRAVGAVTGGAGLLTDAFWEPLGQGTFWLVHALLSLCCRETVYTPADWTVGTSAFSVQIAPSCSGYEGIGLIWAFLGIYLWLFRDRLRFPQAFLLLPLGTLVIWLLNAVRIAALILIGTWGSRQVALGGFHSQAGWLAFNLAALALVFLTQRMRLFSTQTGSAAGPNPTAA